MGELSHSVEAHKPSFLKRKLIIGIVILVLLASGISGGYFYVSSNLTEVSNDPSVEPVNISIPKGASTSQIGQILAQAGLIKNPRFFALYSRFKKLDGSFRSGEYRLSPAQDMDSLMAELKKGQGPVTIRVIIPEGYSTKQIVDLLVQQNLINRDKFTGLIRSHDFGFDFLKGIPQSDLRLEGFLFPATYDIPKGSTEEEIIRIMLKRFEQELTPEIRQAIANKGWNVVKFVTLSSLIEKEAQKAEDRPVISGVFQNRLQKGMALQSCATIQFLLGEPKPVLLNKDLEIKSPYNTYKNPGLPPGPIANPGTASLQAAAFPAKTDYLYFVAKPDGYHAFANTFEEHLRNQKKYQQ